MITGRTLHQRAYASALLVVFLCALFVPLPHTVVSEDSGSVTVSIVPEVSTETPLPTVVVDPVPTSPVTVTPTVAVVPEATLPTIPAGSDDDGQGSPNESGMGLTPTSVPAEVAHVSSPLTQPRPLSTISAWFWFDDELSPQQHSLRLAVMDFRSVDLGWGVKLSSEESVSVDSVEAEQPNQVAIPFMSTPHDTWTPILILRAQPSQAYALSTYRVLVHQQYEEHETTLILLLPFAP